MKSVVICSAAVSFHSSTLEASKLPTPAATGKDGYSLNTRPALTRLRITTPMTGTPRTRRSRSRLQRLPPRNPLNNRLSIPSFPVPEPKARNPGSANPVSLAASIHWSLSKDPSIKDTINKPVTSESTRKTSTVKLIDSRMEGMFKIPVFPKAYKTVRVKVVMVASARSQVKRTW